MMRNPIILFVTNKDDFTIDYLIYKLRNNFPGVEYFRLNSDDIADLSITFDPSRSARITYADTTFDLSKLRSIYYRRAPTIFPSSSIIEDTPYVNAERKAFLEGMLLSLDAKWVNPLDRTFTAERKLYQLNLARSVGFMTPETIVSNNPLLIKNFANKHGECIIKPITHGLQVTSKSTYSIYTNSIRPATWLDGTETVECPVLVQSRIFGRLDIRVTIIGQLVTAVEIARDDDSVDWRRPELTKTYKIHKLPTKIELLLLSMHSQLGLLYSASDLILTSSGDYYFLEVNPAGEWVWLERELDLSLSNQLLKLLIN